MTSETDKIIIKSYLENSESEIEISIGRILLSSGDLNVNPASFEIDDIIGVVNKYLKEKKETFKKKICVEWDVDGKLIELKTANSIELIAVITDLIAPYVGAPPAAMVATLLFKKGIDNLCK